MTGSTPASGDDIKKLWGMIKDIGAAVLNQTDTESRQRLWIAVVWWKKALERF